MHNQADSLQITKKQDETERNKQKKKKQRTYESNQGNPSPIHTPKLVLLAQTSVLWLTCCGNNLHFWDNSNIFTGQLNWNDGTEMKKKKNHQACFIWYRVSAASAKVDVINLKTSQHAEVLY